MRSQMTNMTTGKGDSRSAWFVPCMATRRERGGGGTLWLGSPNAEPPLADGAAARSPTSPQEGETQPGRPTSE
jgi:hypothetical protein